MTGRSTAQSLTFLTGAAAAGAAGMYLFDVNAGRRRRALLRDKAVLAWHETAEAADVTRRDLVNRARGILAETRNLLKKEQVDDAPALASALPEWRLRNG